ncbi:MAG TPA: alpha/beta fold hydrolase [Pyrinomonadaceae bacterium]|nr:alpha/beta fold hydrolase [Pyrinomonadaceae bacterium]
MFRLFLLCLSGFIAISATFHVRAQQPPIIDRELIFGNPEYAGAQLSPNGRFISFIKPYKGTMNVWVKEFAEPFEKARPLTADTARPIRSYFWSLDSKYILYVQDKGGDENFNVYAVNPLEPPAEGSDVPKARNLTDAAGVRAIIQHLPESDPDAIYVSLNIRDKAWHDLYKIKISTGEKTLISENKDRYQSIIFDNADKMRLVTRSAQNGDTEFLRVNPDGTTTKIYSCNTFETCSPIRFHKDNKQVYITSNKGNVDLIGLYLMDAETGATTLVENDPLGKVDFGGASFSEVTKELVATSYEDERERVYFKDKKLERDYDRIEKQVGDKDINFVSSTRDENLFIVSTTSDTDPGTIWVYDRKNNKLSPLYRIREKLDRAALSPMKAIKYKSSDGLEIPAFLTLPKGLEPKNLPLVVFPHGGPWARDFWGYNSYAQFLSNRGYAVLQPNFRGSTGYGKKFLNAGNNEWGQKMQDDITWGVKYLVSQGIVDPKRVGIMGGSYGGYATLAGVAFTPDVYSAAVAIVAPSNLITLLESIPPYWEAARTLFNERMGNPNTPEGLAQLKRQSPLNSADKIKTPLMIVQGANDPRVNKRESDQIVAALQKRNYPVEYILAPDEGHGFARPVNNMAMIAAAERFLAKHLGGRFQESMSPEVAKRLAEITVDPKTVGVVKTSDPSEISKVVGKWRLSVAGPGETIEIVLEIKNDSGKLSGTMSSMIGNGTLEEAQAAGGKLSGTIRANIQGQPIDLQLDATVSGNEISGNFSVPGMGSFPFTGKKE